jgi:Fe-S cluster biogenesis protein NfuA
MFTTTTAAAAAREAHQTMHHRQHRTHRRFLGQQMQQKRSIFIQTQSTPNPSSLMFLPGKPVLEDSSSMNFSSARESMRSPLAKSLFTIDGVTGVFFGADFVTVTKSEAFDWEMLKPEVFAKIMDFYASGEPVVKEENGEVEEADDPNRILDTDSETVAMIKELLETRIKPAVAEDGGDIAFKKFDEQDGLVYVELRGACDGCPSSTVTLKSGIENMLMHYVPEVKGVVPWEGDKEMDLLDMADLMRGR